MKTDYQTHFRLRSWTWILVLAIVALAIGGVVYVFLRTEEAVFIHFLSAWLNGPDLGWGGYLFHSGRHVLPDWMLYSLPSGLWAFAYSLLITRIWYGHQHPARITWFASIPLLAFGFELFQLWGIIPGTFCLIDLLFSVLGIISGLLLALQWSKPKNDSRYETKITLLPH